MSKKETMQPFDPSKGRKNREVKATTVAKMVKQRIGPIELGTDNPQDIINLGWVDPDKIIFNYSRQRFAEPSHQKNLDKKLEKLELNYWEKDAPAKEERPSIKKIREN